jgi:hypothetical protein
MKAIRGERLARTKKLAPVVGLVVSLAWAPSALAITLCTMPDGKKCAGDNPPVDCVEKGRYENPPETADDAGDGKTSAELASEDAARTKDDLDALKRRRQIEREMDETASALRRVREMIAGTPNIAGHSGGHASKALLEYQRNQKRLDLVNEDLRAREGVLASHFANIQAEFDALTEEVRARHDGVLPSTWSAKPRCAACP